MLFEPLCLGSPVRRRAGFWHGCGSRGAQLPQTVKAAKSKGGLGFVAGLKGGVMASERDGGAC